VSRLRRLTVAVRSLLTSRGSPTPEAEVEGREELLRFLGGSKTGEEAGEG